MRSAAEAGVRVVDSAAQVPATAWDALVGPEDLFLSSRWLRVAEATAGVPMRYLLLARGGRPVAGLPAALAGTAAPWLSGRPDTLLERCAREGMPGAAECRGALPVDLAGALLPSLVCGGRHLGRTRVVGGPAAGAVNGDGTRAAGAAAELVAAAERLARTLGARSVAFLYVDDRDAALRGALAARGYAGHVSGSYSWLPLAPGGFSGWLAGLSAHRRRRVLADRRRLEAAGVQVRLEPLTAAAIPRLAELEAELLTRYGLRWVPAQSERVLRRVLAELGGDALVSVASGGGGVRGFALVLRHGPAWFAHRAGFDYAWQGRLPLYFEVLYHHLIEQAPAAGVTAIHYGTGSAQAKRSRGCLAADQHAFLLRIPADGGGR
ncbi:MAG TPA: GNAT family N-acetyltransferase [Actinomycetes bacterium]|nr:GNAT family N-acetyltransferase [Actinomycetes bacterium]